TMSAPLSVRDGPPADRGARCRLDFGSAGRSGQHAAAGAGGGPPGTNLREGPAMFREAGTKDGTGRTSPAQDRRRAIVRLRDDLPGWRWQAPDHRDHATVLAPAGAFGLVLTRHAGFVEVANPQAGWLLPYVPLHVLQLYGAVRRERRGQAR